jgi:hypothetical protein
VALTPTQFVILLQDTILKDHEILFQAILKTSTGELVTLFQVNLRTMTTEENPILFILKILTFVGSPILATLWNLKNAFPAIEKRVTTPTNTTKTLLPHFLHAGRLNTLANLNYKKCIQISLNGVASNFQTIQCTTERWGTSRITEKW